MATTDFDRPAETDQDSTRPREANLIRPPAIPQMDIRQTYRQLLAKKPGSTKSPGPPAWARCHSCRLADPNDAEYAIWGEQPPCSNPPTTPTRAPLCTHAPPLTPSTMPPAHRTVG